MSAKQQIQQVDEVTQDKEVFPTGAGTSVLGFKYYLEWHQKPTFDVTQKSNRWRQLREALNNLELGEWLKVPFELTGAYTLKQSVERIRAACYSWEKAVKLQSKKKKLNTGFEDVDETHGIIWVIIIPLPDDNTNEIASLKA